jgi:hypothetical protein
LAKHLALEKEDNTNPKPISGCTHGRAYCRSGFAFSIAGKNGDQPRAWLLGNIVITCNCCVSQILAPSNK